MSKLKELLDIPDKQERLRALIDYAKKLKINYTRASSESGEISENELSILIFEAEGTKQRGAHQNLAFFIMGVFVFAVVVACIFLFTRFLSDFLEVEEKKMMSGEQIENPAAQ